METNYGNTLKPAPMNYNRLIPEDKKKNNVMNLGESEIGEEFIALQLDLEISTVISMSKRVSYSKGGL
jgi:hypothetical protein